MKVEAKKFLFTESESFSSLKCCMNAQGVRWEKYITYTHRVKLLHGLHPISVYYCCACPHGTSVFISEKLHFDLLPELAVAIHDIKAAETVRGSHLLAPLLLLKGMFTLKITFPYNGSESSTYVVWKKSRRLSAQTSMELHC